MPENDNRVDFARLVEWVEGRLPADEARRVEGAVAGADEATLADVAWLRRFRKATENDFIESPPEGLRDALVETFEARARDRRGPGLVERVFARLVFDSNLQPAAGLRAIGARQSRRQLIYHAGTFDLAINLLARSSDNDLDLDCQVLPREVKKPGLFSVQLLRDGRELALTVIDEMGGFTFHSVPPGRYEVVLSAEWIEVSISPIDVGL